MPFGELLDNVQGHKIDMSMSGMFDKAERQKKVDFVNYLYAGTSIVVPKGTGDVGGLAGLCGRRVAVQPDTAFVDMVKLQIPRCGDKTITVVLTDTPSVFVREGKADAAVNEYIVSAANVVTMPDLELSGPQIEAVPYGIAIAKDRTTLTTAIQTALYDMFRDGTYDQLLGSWKIQEGALKTGAINGGV